MNTIQAFFRRHHAVPATDAGPDWRHADEVVLLDWFRRLAAICRCGWDRDQQREATPAERAAQEPLYAAIADEVTRRSGLADASPAIYAAALRIRDTL